MLTFQNVTKEFRLDAENAVTPVRNVSLQVENGELIVILGRSGTGKTTLLNLAAGLVKPSSGQVLIDDEDLATMTDRRISSMRSRKIGFVFQFPSLLPALTILDNVSLPAIFKNGNVNSSAKERAADLLNTLGLSGRKGVYPRYLSAGETKRVVIARSLLNQPDLILADEPTSDLDCRTEKEVMNLFRDINSRGVTFFIVTHNQELAGFATRAFEMRNGELQEFTAK